MPHPDDRIIAPPRPPQTPAHPAGLSDPPHPHPGEPALRRRRTRGAATALFTVIALAGAVAYGGWRVANDDGLQAAAGRVAGAGMASLAFFADLALGYDGPPSPEGKIGPVSQSYGRTPAMVAQANAQSLPAQAASSSSAVKASP